MSKDGLVYLEMLQNVFEFTMLQRLFRLAFDGRLGENFPIEKLEQLIQVASPKTPNLYRTLRWNAQPGLLSAYIKPLKENLSALEKNFSQTVGDAPKDSSFADLALKQILKQSKIIKILANEENSVQGKIKELLEKQDKGSPKWLKEWELLWRTRGKNLETWLENWNELADLTKKAEKILQDASDSRKKPGSDKKAANLEAARLLKGLNEGDAPQIVAVLKLYNAFRVDVDERQVLEENSGLIKLPPSTP